MNMERNLFIKDGKPDEEKRALEDIKNLPPETQDSLARIRSKMLAQRSHPSVPPLTNDSAIAGDLTQPNIKPTEVPLKINPQGAKGHALHLEKSLPTGDRD